MKIIKGEYPDIQEDLATLGKTFKVLDDRERKILRLMYGLEDGQPKSMAEIARRDRVSRERIRQIVSKAFEKINLVLKYEE